jgi:hypothetical protein
MDALYYVSVVAVASLFTASKVDECVTF